MSIKPAAWMQELPKEEGVDRAVRTTTVKEVAEDWENPIPLYTADDLRAAVLAERERCIEVLLSNFDIEDENIFEVAAAIRARK